MRKAAPALARRLDRATVLRIVRERGPISRAEVAAMTGLAKNSVSSIFDALLAEGLIMSHGLADASVRGGRRRELWSVDPGAGCILGLDLERSRVAGALMDFAGRILVKRHATPRGRPGRRSMLRAARTVIDRLLSHESARGATMLGMGVGTFGRLDSAKAVANCYGLLPDWDDVPLKQILEEHSGLDATIETNLVAAAMAEQWFGAAREVRDFAVLLFRTGIGVGLCANGTILDGSSGRAGELGHVTVDEDGPVCICGGQGCLEAVASRAALIAQVEAAATRGIESTLLARRSPRTLTLDTVIDAANAGDALARRLLEETARHVGVALANVLCLTDPALVTIGPALSRAGDVVVATIEHEIRARIPGAGDRRVDIRVTPLGDDLVVLGAGALVLSKVFEG